MTARSAGQDRLGSDCEVLYRSIGILGRHTMSIGARIRSSRFGRPLIAVIAAYAVVAQTLLIVAAGLTLAANAANTPQALELCHHDASGAPSTPAGVPGQSGCNHCIFCFGSHHALAAPPTALSQRVDVDIAAVPWALARSATPHLSAYAIAKPRGPPLQA
jgi:hypothetical protein